MQAMVKAAQRIIQSHSRGMEERPAESERQKSLKTAGAFAQVSPSDFGTLPDGDHDSEL
jgi:hypothetical protein